MYPYFPDRRSAMQGGVQGGGMMAGGEGREEERRGEGDGILAVKGRDDPLIQGNAAADPLNTSLHSREVSDPLVAPGLLPADPIVQSGDDSFTAHESDGDTARILVQGDEHLKLGHLSMQGSNTMATDGSPSNSTEELEAELFDEVFTVDDVIETIGGFGRYQQWLFAILGFTFFVNGALNLQQIVVERAAEIRCFPTAPNCTVCDPVGGEFIGDFADYGSVSASFSLVCGREVLRGSLGSVFFSGFGFGSFFGGILSDKIGRRKGIFVVNGLQLVGSGGFIASNYYLYALFRLIAGAGCGAGIVVNFVLMMEFVGNKHRGWMGGFGMNGLWSFGGLVVGLLASFIHQVNKYSGSDISELRDNERIQQIYLHNDSLSLAEWRAVSSISFILVVIQIVVTVYLPESPRWLLMMGRADEAYNVLHKAAQTNKRSLPRGRLKGMNEIKGIPSELELEDPGEFQITLIMLLCWFTASFTYYGLALNTGSLAGDFYLNMCVNMAVDIPALALSIVMFDRIGRSRSLAITLLIGGFSCVLCNAVPEDNNCAAGECNDVYIKSILAFCGKFMLCITFSAVFVYASEVFPTSVRTQAMGISSLSARVGGISAPLVVLLSTASPSLPMWIFGIISIVAGLFSFRLPETNNRDLADDI
ncbi:hypothetical protein GUITHDRAFT_144075 [Guillardia theta CCMP2712]|uniref:Major facilitator superfamily (MFS) profile domain-containing protein n=1 Tax=Guillardia theta (strain CCMP2712) TaxID=905079 RepID=L1IQX5_GUITC|nr:hypothetical protein GUITHDRAFT_144075 [Guillardia theta CCMP2712]EKX38686.1 hypothetical protein GUITHDRAFT_144075 [Guillardia theta CCMP2712]|eukprot:XP_005825666.1 hypothetical protein GUITHDRAFT_144075 [Guillardia theta CCMP2712]